MQTASETETTGKTIDLRELLEANEESMRVRIASSVMKAVETWRRSTVKGMEQESGMKQLSKHRYHPVYLRHYRAAVAGQKKLDATKLKELEERDAKLYGLRSHATSKEEEEEAADEFPAEVLKLWLMSTGKCFIKWKNLAKLANREEGGRVQETGPSAVGRILHPPGETETERITEDHLWWAEKKHLKPVVWLPERPMGGNHVAHVCERCYKVYVRLEEQRRSATAAIIQDVRQGRKTLGIPSTIRKVEVKPPKTDAEVYRRSLIHHQRHLDPRLRPNVDRVLSSFSSSSSFPDVSSSRRSRSVEPGEASIHRSEWLQMHQDSIAESARYSLLPPSSTLKNWPPAGRPWKERWQLGMFT
ncbi:hypothetical protein GUITHDRAFT_145197 [Guillardia theta CCMP2712]|uniref:Uncharacterized protein n=1 Tax=Guillardia theta (strain CCMP2712) TaxID=905079 RepID=L1IMX6_GUITC|nr:hypothetical protein GUITHDRAFT_145197 [Guillardia theta CCMP2712]EKX37244.1 hypothetical protein GUITHDRAFT_145197 [Guillardia theta CCMP2712]|eukprot:XP_005824224.1 hypothetical protein GUITHDRAFT_145197 [Guillardia theta CCMP2712]